MPEYKWALGNGDIVSADYNRTNDSLSNEQVLAELQSAFQQFGHSVHCEPVSNQLPEVYSISFDDATLGRITICAKGTTPGGRSNLNDEQRTQQKSKYINYAHSKLQAGESAVQLGVYRRDGHTVFCAWMLKQSSAGAETPISKQIKITTIAQAMKEGFVQQDKGAGEYACAFRKEFMYFYIRNASWLHGALVDELADHSTPISDSPVDNEEAFKTWFATLVKDNGEHYSDNTKNQYIGALKAVGSEFAGAIGPLSSIFEIDDVDVFERAVSAIKSDKGYEEFNRSRGNGSLSAGLDLYARFLHEKNDTTSRMFTPEWFQEKESEYPTLDDEAEKLLADFQAKFNPEYLASLSGVEMLNTIFLNAANAENVCRVLEFGPQIKDTHVPIQNELLVQNLEDMQDRQRIRGDAIDFEGYNSKKVILQQLRQKPEIDYEKCSALLFKLIAQVCDHYADHYGINGMQNIVMMYKRDIGNKIYNQMLQHFYCENEFLKEEVVGTRKHNLEPHYGCRERVNLYDAYTENIQSVVFDGIKKGVFDQAKFDSYPELQLARVLEVDEDVQNWLRPAPKEFNITYNHGRSYEPDFVVETESVIYLVEVKGEDKLNDPDVIAKKKRGVQYCEVASHWGKANGYKQWRYLFIPSKQVMPNSSFMQLAKQFHTL